MAKPTRKILLKTIITFLILVLVTAGFLGWVIFAPNTKNIEKEIFFYVPTGATYSSVLDSFETHGLLRHPKNFDEVARFLDYPHHVRPGKYRLKERMNNFELVSLLRSGRQTPVRLVIIKERTKADMAQLLAEKLEPDSAAFIAIFNDSVFLKNYGYNMNTAMCAIIPNTYQFFWDTDPEATFKRLAAERDKFWTAERRSIADSIGLRPNEVYILASIVDEETNKLKDKRLIASVYLNRLNRGMRLQADPTLKFALKKFALRRISGKTLKVQSPYNTYINAGLPPGPICTPSIKTIDAVLHAPKTSYLYFCAKPDFSGYHSFATTYAQHLKNARAYHSALDKLNIH